MHRLRNLLSRTSTAAMAVVVATTMVIVSCSSSPDNPLSPSATSPDGAAAAGIVKATSSPSPSPSPSPSVGNCSPGYYKNHSQLPNPGNQPNVWFGAGFGFCDNAGQPSCQDLDDALNAGGQTSQKAATYLNSVTGFVCHD